MMMLESEEVAGRAVGSVTCCEDWAAYTSCQQVAVDLYLLLPPVRNIFLFVVLFGGNHALNFIY